MPYIWECMCVTDNFQLVECKLHATVGIRYCVKIRALAAAINERVLSSPALHLRAVRADLSTMWQILRPLHMSILPSSTILQCRTSPDYA